MCLAVPAKIISIDGTEARIDIGGIGRMISLKLTPGAKTGDYVLVHAGFAIGVLDEKEARETLDFLEEIDNA
ncbi:MAG: HypC/HybG/HupF family hydrogenase formation chaperone [Syntrophorhabdus sp.]